MAILIALDEAKSQLKITGNSEDDQIQLFIDAATQIVERHTGTPTPDTPLPNCKLAGLIIVQHLWATRRGNMPSASPDLTDSLAYPNYSGYAIPNKALELLGPPAVWCL